MDLPDYFDNFLNNLSISPTYKKLMNEKYDEIVTQLFNNDKLKSLVAGTMIQGSIPRNTAIMSGENNILDIDIVILLSSDDEKTPEYAYDQIMPHFQEQFKGDVKFKKRAINLTLSQFQVDIILATIIDSENKENQYDNELATISQFRKNPAYPSVPKSISPHNIPTMDLATWVLRDPLGQLAWTLKKTKATSQMYPAIVRLIKYWAAHCIHSPLIPRGYWLEYIVGITCPDDINSLAEGFTVTLENILSLFRDDIRRLRKPFLPYPEHEYAIHEGNVLKRVPVPFIVIAYFQVLLTAKKARKALECTDKERSIKLWSEVFNESFTTINR